MKHIKVFEGFLNEGKKFVTKEDLIQIAKDLKIHAAIGEKKVTLYPTCGENDSEYSIRNSHTALNFNTDTGWNNDKPAVFGFYSASGHNLRPIVVKYNLKFSQSGIAGIDSIIKDGNYNIVPMTKEEVLDILQLMNRGLNQEAAAQRDFYSKRGTTSGTID